MIVISLVVVYIFPPLLLVLYADCCQGSYSFLCPEADWRENTPVASDARKWLIDCGGKEKREVLSFLIPAFKVIPSRRWSKANSPRPIPFTVLIYSCPIQGSRLQLTFSKAIRHQGEKMWSTNQS